MEELLTTPRVFKKLPTSDTGEWQTAGIYAKALAASAEAAGKLDAVRDEFDSLVQDVLDGVPNLEAVLGSKLVDQDAKDAIIDKGFSNRASQLVVSFLKVLNRHDRLELLRLVNLAFHEEYDRMRARVRVLVSTAEPLDAAAEKRIEQEIHSRLKVQPVLDKHVQPELIGGIVLRIGDRVYDGSIATQLAKLRERMLNRSVHEIQSRRDRFSSAEGN